MSIIKYLSLCSFILFTSQLMLFSKNYIQYNKPPFGPKFNSYITSSKQINSFISISAYIDIIFFFLIKVKIIHV
jgi:hypothetical protein